MTELATLIEDMIRAGVDPAIIGRTAALFAERDKSVTCHTQEKSPAAIRKARQRERLKAMTDSADAAEGVTCHAGPSPLVPPLFPHTPNTPPLIPPSTSPRPKRVTPKIEFDGQGFSGITPETMLLWREAYPAVNIDVEIRQAAAWLFANPKNKKSNYARFLTNWFTRAQDRAPRGQLYSQRTGQTFTPVRVPSAQLFDRMEETKRMNFENIVKVVTDED